MDFAKAFENFKNIIYDKYKGDPAKIMVHAGTVGWIMSSAAQLYNIAVNKDFTPDEKKFLFPQEALDAAVNITLFYTLTNSCKNLTSKLVSSGKLLSKHLRTYIAEHPVNDLKLGDFNKDLGKIYGDDKEFFEKYHPFKNGVNMAVNTVACIVASNLLTPVIRNKLAAMEQKHAMSKALEPQRIIQTKNPVEIYANKSVLNSNIGLKI